MTILKPENINELHGTIPLQDYEDAIKNTDKFSNEAAITPILQGLYGEVGSIMTVLKKYHREKKAYPVYEEVVEEEFGDVLWYFAALCRRLGSKLDDIFESAADKEGIKIISANDQKNAPIAQSITMTQTAKLETVIMELGCMAAQLLKIKKDSPDAHKNLVNFARCYLQAIQTTEFSFAQIVKSNIKKVRDRFCDPDPESLPDFDKTFLEEEQLPRKFEIHITQRKSGQSYMRWNGVFLGSPLTDNIKDPDGYRFHDVFHLAYAAILHWSPTFRALIKHKRKSDSLFDEAQDGGRAIVIEEGLTAWLYAYARGLHYFEGHKSVSFDVLKVIQKFVQGYEVEQCPLKLWEKAILQGYAVFRKVKQNNGGIVIGNREKREIDYKPIEEKT